MYYSFSKIIFHGISLKVSKLCLLVAIFIIGNLSAYAQKEKNNIYLFDCTGSMITNNLWEPAKTSLDETLKLYSTIPDTYITIVPFGDYPFQVFEFEANKYPSKSQNILGSLNKNIASKPQSSYTNISKAFKEGLNYINPNKDNRIYLLTDGEPNHGDTPDSVAKTISDWCANHKNTRLFYVALTKSALDEKIRNALANCDDAVIIETQGNIIPIFADISPNDIYTNLEELQLPREIEFNLPGNYDIKPLANDSLFEVKISRDKASNGEILVSLVPKRSVVDLHQKFQGEDYEFPVIIESVDNRIQIVNPEVMVHVSDEIPSKLSLAGGKNELAAKGVKWHPSFLWSPAKEDEKITWNLTPIFENELKNSALNLRFSVPEKNNEDFKAWYNDQPLNNGEIITIRPQEEANLTIRFTHNAKTGKRYFELTPVDSSGIDLINDQPADEFTGTTLRTDYSVGWNPLAIVLFWIGIAILIFLLLWFLFLQRIFYPRIKISRIEFKGPGSYYQSKKIKGARKVVLTSQNKKQNPVSKIFTGEIRYVIADHFSPALEIIPAAGKKKKVRIRNVASNVTVWDIYPSSIFQQYEKGSMKKRDSKEECQIEFS